MKLRVVKDRRAVVQRPWLIQNEFGQILMAAGDWEWAFRWAAQLVSVARYNAIALAALSPEEGIH